MLALTVDLFPELALDYGAIGKDSVDSLCIGGIRCIQNRNRPALELAKLILSELDIVAVLSYGIQFLNGTVLVDLVLDPGLVQGKDHLWRTDDGGYRGLGGDVYGLPLDLYVGWLGDVVVDLLDVVVVDQHLAVYQ